MKQKTIATDLTQGSVLGQMVRFSVPFLLSILLQTAYNMADMIIVGHAVGSAGLTAVSLGGQVTNFLTIMGANFASGGQIFVAQTTGRGDRAGLGRAVGSMITIICAMSVVLTCVGFAFYPDILRLLNTPEASFSYACDYLKVCCAGLFFIYGYNAVCAALRGMGDSRLPLLFVAIASVINIFLDIWLVIGLQMGPKGAAIATVISQGTAFFSAMLVLYRKRRVLGFVLSARIFLPGRTETKTIFRLGIPTAMQQVAIQCSMLYIGTFINAYGLTAATVNGIGGKLYSVVTIFTTTAQITASVMTGQCVGAGRTERVRSIILWGLLFSIGSTIVFSIIGLLFPRQVFAFFDSDPQVLDMAGEYLRISCILFLGFGFMGPPLGLVLGVGNANLSMMIALLDGVLARIALSLLFGRWLGMGLNGFFLGNALAGWVSVNLSWSYWLSGRWKKRASLLQN